MSYYDVDWQQFGTAAIIGMWVLLAIIGGIDLWLENRRASRR